MRREDRKKLTSNEMYLNECLSILDGKIRAVGFNFFYEDGSTRAVNHINIESYNHGTITCVCGKNMIQINWDGTNFNPVFVSRGNGNFIYKLNPLGIEYFYTERKLNNNTTEKKIFRKVGSSSEYFKFMQSGSMTLLMDYCGYDEKGKIALKNTKIDDCTDKQLIEYMEAQKQIFEEYEQKLMCDMTVPEKAERLFEELVADKFDDFVDEHPVLGEDFTQEDLDEIEAFVPEGECADIFDINYSVDGISLPSDDDQPYSRDYPDHIEDFDYQEYIKKNKSGTDEDRIVYSVGPDEEPKDSDDKNDSIDDEVCDDDFEYEEFDDSYSDLTDFSAKEFSADDSNFVVKLNDDVVDGMLKSDILDEITECALDANQESLSLRDIQYDFMSEIRKMRAIIRKRKELFDKRKNDQSDMSNIDKNDYKDIDD